MLQRAADRVVPLALLAFLTFAPVGASADVLIRWDQDSIPSPQALGISTVVIPASRPAAVRAALGQGYRVHVEIAVADAATYAPIAGTAGVIVRGASTPDQLARLDRAFAGAGFVRAAEDRGKWPHIRTNWVTRNKDVLQVTNRSAQPWLENNGALIAIAADRSSEGRRMVLTYTWQPVTVADLDQGPRLENYLVAIAEAGSFGADLLLPLHERFERALLAGAPDARAEWIEIRKSIEFYGWNAAVPRQLIANVGVVTGDPMRDFELLNLLVRHNLPFTMIAPADVTPDRLTGIELLIVLDALDERAKQRVREFGATGKGQVVERANVPGDPNTFALEMRQLLGPERRVVDIWNGITVLVVPYSRTADGDEVLTVVNYAAQPLPVQIRVRGRFSEVQYEAPGEPAVLLASDVRNGGTEFVLPALSTGGRVFLHRMP
jgi:hypothetical protein